MKIDLDEIKKELDAGREVVLEPLPNFMEDKSKFTRDLYLTHFKDGGNLIITKEMLTGFKVKDTWEQVPFEYLHYFRIKRTSNYDPIEGEGTLPSLNLQGKGTPIYSKINSQNSDPDLSDKPTFDDLIDVAVQAYKDGVLSEVDLGDNGVYLTGLGVISSIGGSSMFQDAINDIKSLYTETFVIDRISDILKLNDEAEIRLINGVSGRFVKEYDNGARVRMIVCGESHKVPFFTLKGATVTQNMTRKEIL